GSSPSIATISSRRRPRGSRFAAARTCAATPSNSSGSSRPTCGAKTSSGSRRKRRARTSRSSPAPSAARPLDAVALEWAHDRRAVDRRMGTAPHLELQAELVLAEELVEFLAAESADGEDLVRLRIVLEEDRREGLRRGTGDHARAGGRIVDAAIRAARDDFSFPGDGTRSVAIADEAHLARGIGHLVRA